MRLVAKDSVYLIYEATRLHSALTVPGAFPSSFSIGTYGALHAHVNDQPTRWVIIRLYLSFDDWFLFIAIGITSRDCPLHITNTYQIWELGGGDLSSCSFPSSLVYLI